MRSYLPKDEVTEAEILGKVKTGDVETRIFTPAEFETLIHAAPARLIPILAVGAFAGMRMAELASHRGEEGAPSRYARL